MGGGKKRSWQEIEDIKSVIRERLLEGDTPENIRHHLNDMPRRTYYDYIALIGKEDKKNLRNRGLNLVEFEMERARERLLAVIKINLGIARNPMSKDADRILAGQAVRNYSIDLARLVKGIIEEPNTPGNGHSGGTIYSNVSASPQAEPTEESIIV